MSNKRNNDNNNNNNQKIDFGPLLNTLENINNTLKTIANVFYEQNNESNNQQKKIEDAINKQLNLFRDVTYTFKNVLYQLRREEEEQRRKQSQNNTQNIDKQENILKAGFKHLISALKGLGKYQIATFQSIDRFLKDQNEFKTKQAREINNLFGRVNSNTQKFFRQFIQEIDNIYNEKNYFKSMADSLKHIAEVHILLKPFVRNMVAKGINPLCCGGSGLSGTGSENLKTNQLLHVSGEDVKTNLEKILRYTRYGANIEEDITKILTSIEENQNSFRKFFSKLPLIGGFAANDQIRLLKAAQSGILQNLLQSTYFNIEEETLQKFLNLDMKQREKFQDRLIQLISRYTDKQGRIDETVLTSLSNNINSLISYINTFNKYSQYFTDPDKFSIKKLLLSLDKQFILQTRFLESLGNVTQDLEIQLKAYNTTLQNQLSEDTLKDINNILRSVVLRDIAQGKISEANLHNINSLIENILRQKNLSEEQIRVILELVSNTYTKLTSNYSLHLRDAIERELQYRGISRKTIDDIAKRLGSDYGNVVEDLAKNMILRKSKMFKLTTSLLNNKVYKIFETITASIAIKSLVLFNIPFLGPALAGLGFPWNIAVGLLMAPFVYKRGAIISFMARHLPSLIQKGFDKARDIITKITTKVTTKLSKYIPEPIKDFFDTMISDLRDAITGIIIKTQNAITRVIKTITRPQDIIAKIVTKATTSLLKYIPNPVKNLFNSIITNIRDAITKATTKLSKFIPDKVKNLFNTMVTNIQNTITKATTNIRNMLAKSTLSKLWNSSIMFKLRTVVGTSVGNIARSFLGLQLKQPSEPIKAETIQRAYTGETVNTLEQQPKLSVAETILNRISGKIQDLADVLPSTLNNIQSTLNNIKDINNKMVSNINISSITESIKDLKEYIGQTIGKLQSDIIKAIDNSLNNIYTLLQTYVTSRQTFESNIIQVINNLENNIVQSLNNIYTLLQTYVDDKFGNTIQSIVQSIDRLQKQISQPIGKLQKSINQSISSLQDNTIQVLNNIHTTLQTYLDNILTNIKNIPSALNNIIKTLDTTKNINLDSAFQSELSDHVKLIGEITDNIRVHTIDIDQKLKTLNESLNRLYDQYAIKRDGTDSIKVYVTNFDEICNCIKQRTTVPPLPGVSGFMGSSGFGGLLGTFLGGLPTIVENFVNPFLSGTGDLSLKSLWPLLLSVPLLSGSARKGLLKLGFKGLKWLGGKGIQGLKWLGGKGIEGMKQLKDKFQAKAGKTDEIIDEVGKTSKSTSKVGKTDELIDKTGKTGESIDDASKGTEKTAPKKGSGLLSKIAGSKITKAAMGVLSTAAGVTVSEAIEGPAGLVAGLAVPAAIDFVTDKLLNRGQKGEGVIDSVKDLEKAVPKKETGLLSKIADSKLVKSAAGILGRAVIPRAAGLAIGGAIGGPAGVLASLALPTVADLAIDKLVNRNQSSEGLTSNVKEPEKSSKGTISNVKEPEKTAPKKEPGLLSKVADSKLVKSATGIVSKVATSGAAKAVIGGALGGSVGLVAGLAVPAAIDFVKDKILNRGQSSKDTTSSTSSAASSAVQSKSVEQHDFASIYNILQAQHEQQQKTNTILNDMHNTLKTVNNSITEMNNLIKTRIVDNITTTIQQNNNIVTYRSVEQPASIMDKINQAKKSLGF